MARSFNGTTDHIDAGLATGSTTMTMACWVNLTSSQAGAAFFSQGTVFSDGVLMRVQSSVFYNSIQGTGNFATSASFTLGVWAHVAIVATPGSFLAYFNGVQVYSAVITLIGATSHTTIGDRSDHGDPFNGLLADCAIWNTNLSPSQITALASGARPVNVNSANLKSWWPLGSSLVAGLEPDLSGNANNGTLTGTTITASPNQIRRGARYFNAATDLVNVTSFPAIAMPLTLACWFNLATLPAVSSSGTLFTINSSSSNNDWWRLVITNSSGSVEFGADQNSISGSYLNKFINPPTLVVNTWYQGACVFTSNSSRTLYLNGGNALGDVQVGATPLSINQVSMGLLQRNASPVDPFNGQVADCAVWNVALASGDIANLFAGARPNTISPSNLKGWWPLEANGATENDLSGNSNTGTVTGTTSWLGPPYTWRIG